jgi:hypothetical protein
MRSALVQKWKMGSFIQTFIIAAICGGVGPQSSLCHFLISYKQKTVKRTVGRREARKANGISERSKTIKYKK